MATPGSPSFLYHLYPLGCLGADQGGSDRACRRSLRELVDWLPHVESLGADALMLGPVSSSLSHGYDTVTHLEIDPRLGSLDDLDALVAAASARGMGVVLDGAFAYSSRQFHRLADPDEVSDPWFNSTTFSGVTEYALMHGSREWLSGGAVEAMLSTLRVHRHNVAGRTPPHTFLGNHDFARLADTVPARAVPIGFALLLTLPGCPSIYYGDEARVTSTWTQGGSDALLRPPLSAADVAGCPDLLASVQALGRFRRENPWLRSAALDAIAARAGSLADTVRGPGQAIRVYLNPTAEPVALPDDEPVLADPARGGRAGLAAHGWQIRNI